MIKQAGPVAVIPVGARHRHSAQPSPPSPLVPGGSHRHPGQHAVQLGCHRSAEGPDWPHSCPYDNAYQSGLGAGHHTHPLELAVRHHCC